MTDLFADSRPDFPDRPVVTHWWVMRLNDLDKLARRQHGVVARRQTQLSESSWRRAINAGTLVRLHDGVARLVDTADTIEQRIMAGVLAGGDGAIASHRSSAHLHGVPGLADSPVDLIAPDRDAAIGSRTRDVDAMPGCVVHRPRDTRRLSPHRLDGIPCTNILRTLLDLGAVAPNAVHGALGHALTTGIVSLSAVESAVQQHARRGRHGVVALRNAVDDWAIDAKPADSVLEPAMYRLTRAYGLPPIEFHPTIGGREVDFRITGTPIVIECDGWTYHGRSKEAFERDRAMDAEFATHGWIVLRFTYRRITRRPGEVARTIERAIERWTDLPSPDAA